MYVSVKCRLPAHAVHVFRKLCREKALRKYVRGGRGGGESTINKIEIEKESNKKHINNLKRCAVLEAEY